MEQSLNYINPKRKSYHKLIPVDLNKQQNEFQKKNVYGISNYFQLTDSLRERLQDPILLSKKCRLSFIPSSLFGLNCQTVAIIESKQFQSFWISLDFTGFYWLLLDPTKFYQILLDFTCKKIHIINMGISSFESFNDWRCDFSSKPSEIVSSGQITNSSAIIRKNHI